MLSKYANVSAQPCSLAAGAGLLSSDMNSQIACPTVLQCCLYRSAAATNAAKVLCDVRFAYCVDGAAVMRGLCDFEICNCEVAHHDFVVSEQAETSPVINRLLEV